MRVSVVVVTYHSADTLSACLASVPSGTELVVVDNAVGDGSAEIARAHGARVMESGSNIGFSRGANVGAAATSGEAILFLNPDATLGLSAIEGMVAELRDTKVAVVGPERLTSGETDLKAFWPYPSARRTWIDQLGLHRLFTHDVEGGFIVGTCMLVRRSAFDDVHGFAEAFWLYGEDADLCRRLDDRGWTSILAPGVEVNHLGGYSAAQLTTSFEHFHLGAERFIALHEGPAALLGHRLAVLLGAIARTILFAAKDPSRSRWFARLARRQAELLVRSPLAVREP